MAVWWTGAAPGILGGWRELAARDIRVTLAGDALEDLRQRLPRTRLPAADGDGWGRGVPRSWLAALLADWQKFDVAAFQARLDGLTHREVTVDGQRIHLVHAPPGRARSRCRCC